MHHKGVRIAFTALVLALCAHAAFSWAGWTPLDDGFTLAYARRMVEGQIPHRDFIMIRPALSPLLHAPEVLLGGQYLYWISRLFVWLEYGVIAACWSYSFVKLIPLKPFAATSLVMILFCGTASDFPILAWHTTDGMFLAAIGTALIVSRRSNRWTTTGYCILAGAYLCKQSFALLPIATLLAMGDRRNIRSWIAIAIPGLAYAGMLACVGAWHDAMIQFSSQTGLIHAGLLKYLASRAVLGTAIGAIAVQYRPRVGAVALVLLAGLVGILCCGVNFLDASSKSFFLFGLLVGAILSGWNSISTGVRTFAILALANAWSASLSLGVNYPYVGAGIVFVAVTAISVEGCDLSNLFWRRSCATIAVAYLVAFTWTRTAHLYRDQPLWLPKVALAGILPGGRLIRANPDTAQYLRELRQIVDGCSARNERYAILPDASGWWPEASQSDPLPIDWPLPAELNSKQLMDRELREIDRLRGHITIIVSRVKAWELPNGFRGAGDVYEPTHRVRETYRKIDQTPLFDVYR